MANTCSICTHPAGETIDAMLLDADTTLQMVADWMAQEYPEENVPSISFLSKHRKFHIKKQLAAPSRLHLKDGQLVDAEGRPIESIGIASALKAIVTVGIRNILLDPTRVSPKDTIEALKLMRMLGNGSEDMEEVLQFWATSVKRPRGKRRKEAEVVEAEVTVVEHGPIETADPFAELFGTDEEDEEEDEE